MKELIERADRDKERRAVERLTAVRVAVPATTPEAQTAVEVEGGEVV